MRLWKARVDELDCSYRREVTQYKAEKEPCITSRRPRCLYVKGEMTDSN